MCPEIERPTCPYCQTLMIPYVYGMPPGPEPGDGGADDFFITGCEPRMFDWQPQWGCRTCDNRSEYDDDYDE